MSRVEQRISLVTLGVKDLSRARRFYEAMGWRNARQPDDEVAFFQAGGMVFGLWTKLPAAREGGSGIELAYNVRTPSEVDEVLAQAERAGGKIARKAEQMEWGGYSGAFSDPDGHVWEVAHNPDWPLMEDGSVVLA
jgi:predicted lactoylglutathione lyase